MLQEIDAAVTFLTRLVAAKSVDPGGSTSTNTSVQSSTSNTPISSLSPNSSTTNTNNNFHSTNLLTSEKIEEFSRKLTTILQNRFRNHWYPEKPSRGQGYRCIRINSNCRVDTSIEQACYECGFSYDLLHLPMELTLWIDPNEVTCRFGEHKGSYCVVTKLRDGRHESYVDQINIDELEQRSLERSKLSSFDIANSNCRKKRIGGGRQKNNSIPGMYSGVNANNTPPYHGMHQMNGNLVNGGSSNHLGTTASGHSQHAVPVTTTTNVNGFVEFSPNGGIMSTTSATNMAASYQNQFATQAHYYGASQTPFHQTHVSAMPGAVTHNTHYGSPTNLFTKFSIGLTQQGPNGQPGGGPTLQTNRTGLNTGSLSTSDYNQSILMEKDRRHTNSMTATAAAAASAATIVTSRF